MCKLYIWYLRTKWQDIVIMIMIQRIIYSSFLQIDLRIGFKNDDDILFQDLIGYAQSIASLFLWVIGREVEEQICLS